MIHPWQRSLWSRFWAQSGRLPHALLFIGPVGQGKRDFAEAVAARLLCDNASGEAEACGTCTPCQWRITGNHPDLIHLIPAADEEGDDPVEAGGKARSRQIVIEQVRQLQASLTVGSHHGRGRAVIVDPAEAMNVYTANALLKLLEEPPAGTVFLLVSSNPARLLPTLRSRCQSWNFRLPSLAEANAWLTDAVGKGASVGDLLDLVGQAPLAARDLAGRGGDAMLTRFVGDLAVPGSIDPIQLAGKWEAWLKSKDAIAAGFDMVQLVEWLQKWVADLACLRLGGVPRFFRSRQAELQHLVGDLSVAAVLGCYNDLLQIRRVAQHPLNARLMLEDMLVRYARALYGARS